MFKHLRATAMGLLAMVAGGVADPTATEPAFEAPDGASLVAIVTDPALDEISGFAVSRRHPDLLWTHNDSGDAAHIHAVGIDGRRRATLALRGAVHVDYEDIASFELDGVAYLMVGDIGDNGGVRRELQLYVLREPDLIADGESALAWTLRFRWPDGPRDSEALAVDPVRGEVLLASKKRVPAELFRLPLRPSGEEVLVAEPIGLFTHISQPTEADLRQNPVYGRYRAQVTGMDLSTDGNRLAVLTYLQAYVYERADQESWKQAIRRAPVEVQFPWLAQAEAIAFSVDGRSLWVGTERLPAPLLQLHVPDAQAP
jgi:hypothetical protein